MSRVFNALTAEPWAITPDELQKIAHRAPPRHAGWRKDGEMPAYIKRDYELMAGPGAQKLAGAQRAFLIDGVAILPITGPIFPRANMMTECRARPRCRCCRTTTAPRWQQPEIGAILLLIDSPGGAVSGINAFADAVAAGAKKKATTAYVAGTAASAAYWIASVGRRDRDRSHRGGRLDRRRRRCPVQVAPDGNGEVWLDIVSTNAPNKRPDRHHRGGPRRDRLHPRRDREAVRRRRRQGPQDHATDKVLADFGRRRQGRRRWVKAGMADRVASYDATLNALRRQVANRASFSR
jgi:hypothetical protein